jgi:hypothetical protein
VGQQLTSRQVRLQTKQHAGPRLLDRRSGKRGVSFVDSGVVSSDHVPPAIGPLLNRVNIVLPARLGSQEDIGGPSATSSPLLSRSRSNPPSPIQISERP